MDEGYVRKYETLYRRHWWWRAREELLVKEIRKLVPKDGSGATFFDIGCGNGFFFPRLSEFGKAQGIESNPLLLAGGAREGVHLSRLEDYSSEDKFDFVLMLDVLEHIEEDAGFLRKAAGFMKDGGKILVTVPSSQILFTSHDRINQHLRRYSRTALYNLSRKCGLRPIQLKFLFLWPAFVKLAIRLVETFRQSQVASDTIPSPAINSLLFKTCLLEARFFENILQPWGSSLLLVAEKDSSGK